MKVSLIAEDFSALGRISMVSALSIFTALNLPTAALPTVILSTQSEGFGTPKALTTTTWLTQATAHWQQHDEVVYQAALIGYVGNVDSVVALNNLLVTQKIKLVVVDPVMGDDGLLYPGFNVRYVEAIRKLAQIATILTPNLTELYLLAGQKYDAKPTKNKVTNLINIIKQNGINAQIIVTGIENEHEIGLFYPDQNGAYQWYGFPKIVGHFYGAGDAFSATLCGYLVAGLTFETAVKTAVTGIYQSIVVTANNPQADLKYGLQLNTLLLQLAKFSLATKNMQTEAQNEH